MKKYFLGLIVTLAISTLGAEQPDAAKRTKADVIEQWQHDRFGVFIHWGASSILDAGAGSWCRKDNYNGNKGKQGNKTSATIPEVIKSGDYLKMKGKRPIPQEIYDNLHHVHNPAKFDAKEWVKIFKESGAGYIVFTAKHHDGFCNFETKTQDYNIMNTPFKRDICKELVEACRAEGLRIFWYYSPPDWWNPKWESRKDTSYEDTHFLPQVEELVKNYGPIEGIWWDGNQITKKYAEKTVELIKKHQPWALLNPRLGGGVSGDFNTPEQKLGEFKMNRRWESCITMTGSSWFWNGGKDYKSLDTCISILVQCVIGDGNLLLDVGPKADGTLDQRAIDTYKGMGAWLGRYGKAVKGTRGGPYKPGPWGGSTRTKDKVYLHILQKNETGQLVLPDLGLKVKAARCLNNGEDVKLDQTNDQLTVNFPVLLKDVDTVLELDIDGDPLQIKPIESVEKLKHNICDDASFEASSFDNVDHKPEALVHHSWKGGMKSTLQFGEPGYEAEQEKLKALESKIKKNPWNKYHIGHPYRFWQVKKNDKDPWVSLKLKQKENFSQIYLWENHGHIKSFAFDAMVDGQWKELFVEGNGMGIYNRKLAKPIETQEIRVRILESTGVISMNALELFK